MWWICAAVQEYIMRSWSLVKMGTTAAQKKLFFNLRRAKSQMQALDDGDLRPDQVEKIATRFGVTEKDVVSMNQRLGGDTSLNALVRSDAEGISAAVGMDVEPGEDVSAGTAPSRGST
jgi:RNA polymerase sigma-32 factor